MPLTTLDLRNFNTSNVTDMYAMFSNNENLENLYINFDTGNVKNMDYMFSFCENLKNVDCSQWNVNNVTSHSSFNKNSSGVIAPIWKK